MKLSGRGNKSRQLGYLGLEGADQFHNIQAVVLGLMSVQVKKGLKLLFISLHKKSLQLAALFPLEVIESRAYLVRSKVISMTLGILKDPGVAFLLIDFL